jgi:type II secretory ATPase GspE/PulE/Tfp pilus assembly ATPase PilB-like protein
MYLSSVTHYPPSLGIVCSTQYRTPKENLSGFGEEHKMFKSTGKRNSSHPSYRGRWPIYLLLEVNCTSYEVISVEESLVCYTNYKVRIWLPFLQALHLHP